MGRTCLAAQIKKATITHLWPVIECLGRFWHWGKTTIHHLHNTEYLGIFQDYIKPWHARMARGSASRGVDLSRNQVGRRISGTHL